MVRIIPADVFEITKEVNKEYSSISPIAYVNTIGISGNPLSPLAEKKDAFSIILSPLSHRNQITENSIR